MKGFTMDDKVRRQLEGLYGPLATGEYTIGDTISFPGGRGEIIWVTQAPTGLTYIVQQGNDFPIPVRARDVTQDN